MTCEETDALLVEYVEGALDDVRGEEVRSHVSACAVCKGRLRATRDLLRDLGAVRSMEVAQSSAGEARDARAGRGERRGLPPRLGDFEPLEELGRGGMGVVYRARQISLGRIVALKVLTLPPGAGDRAADRFRREAHAAAQLHHTNIVPIYAQGEQDGHLFYAMELIDGRPLGDVLRDDPTLAPLPVAGQAGTTRQPWSARQPGPRESQNEVPTETLLDAHASTVREPVPPPTRAARRSPPSAASPDAKMSSATLSHSGTRRHTHHYKRLARLMAEVADGLAHAHRLGIIHRDIKPQNLLLGRDDHLHITDFGLARLLDEPGMTLSAELVGTPAYMAPEQLGAGGRSIDARTDVYSLGVTLFELLTLRRPFDGQTFDQIITAVLKKEPLRPRRIDAHIPVDLETICLRAMEKEPARRFKSADDLAAELRRYAGDFPIVSRRIGPLQRAVRWMKRHPATTSAIGAATLVAILAPLLYVTYDAYEQQVVRRAYEVLLDDYRDVDRARQHLGWIRSFGRSTRERTLFEALAVLLDDRTAAREILEPLTRQRPVDREAHYMMAWADRLSFDSARSFIETADQSPAEDTAAGMFFRGMALIRADPAEAERSFERARELRPRFAQAMAQQARAINMLLYYRTPEEILRYDNAVKALEAAALLQPDKAYPRYLLALTHRFAAEIYTTENKPEAARRSYEDGLRAARDAQRVEPKSRSGFAAEANVLESMGQYADAVQAWNRSTKPGVENADANIVECQQYRMRLLFWLNDIVPAIEAFHEYVNPASQDALVAFYDVLLLMSSGAVKDVDARLARAADEVGPGVEQRALVFAAYRISGRIPPAALLAQGEAFRGLQAWWTPSFAETLREFLLGEVDEQTLLASAQSSERAPHEQRFLLAPAEFFIGVIALCDGRREEAERWLTSSSRRFDDEAYCFPALLLAEKLRLDPDWPEWLISAGVSRPPRTGG